MAGEFASRRGIQLKHLVLGYLHRRGLLKSLRGGFGLRLEAGARAPSPGQRQRLERLLFSTSHWAHCASRVAHVYLGLSFRFCGRLGGLLKPWMTSLQAFRIGETTVGSLCNACRGVWQETVQIAPSQETCGWCDY